MSVRVRRSRAWLVALALLGACKGDPVIVGSQCPAPATGKATLAEPDAGGGLVYGTSCAPCMPDDVTLDERGCPVLVTWASCGGDICIYGNLVRKPIVDAGTDGGDDDAGDEDAGGEGAP